MKRVLEKWPCGGRFVNVKHSALMDHYSHTCSCAQHTHAHICIHIQAREIIDTYTYRYKGITVDRCKFPDTHNSIHNIRIRLPINFFFQAVLTN